jgi:hypothetical protein
VGSSLNATETTVTSSFEDDHAPASGRRGFRLLSVAAGAALAMLLVALGTRDIADATAKPLWIDSPPELLPGVVDPGGAATERQALRLDEGIDWKQVEVWTEFGPAAGATHEG